MSFDINQFYDQLDAQYEKRDNVATEAFLIRQKDAAYQAGAPQLVNDSCPSCVPALEPNYAYISVCNELACFYRGLSRWQESLDVFALAQTELESLYKQNTAEYATVLLNKAGTYRYMGDPQLALEHFIKAGKIFEQQDNTCKETLAGLYNNTGLVYLDLKQPDLALDCFKSAISLINDNFDNIVELGTTWNNIANAYSILNNKNEAQSAIQTAVEILEKLDCGNNPHYPAALNTRGVYAYKSGNYADALDDFTKALEKTKAVYGENIEYAYGCENCAMACEKLNRMEDATNWRVKSKTIQARLVQA